MSYFDDHENRIVFGTRRKKVSFWTDYDYDYDPSDYEREPSCKYCGSTDVRWRQQGGKWVLFSNKPGVVHSCDVSGDFDDVSNEAPLP